MAPLTTFDTPSTSAALAGPVGRRQDRSQYRALIVDDDSDMVRMLEAVLRAGDFDTQGTFDGHGGLTLFSTYQPDVILLDLMMPRMSGWDVLTELRRFSDVPVLVVTARSSQDAIARCVACGANDYLVKPFYPHELLARIHSLVSRYADGHSLVVIDGVLEVDFADAGVTLHRQRVELTSLEYHVLYVLARNAGSPVALSTIAQAVWGCATPQAMERVKWVVLLLRRKLETNVARPRLIVTHNSDSYRLGSRIAVSQPRT